MADVTTVPVKSAWASKVNWLQVISAAATFATAIVAAAHLPAGQAVAATAVAGGTGDFLTVLVRSFLPNSALLSSLPSGGQ